MLLVRVRGSVIHEEEEGDRTPEQAVVDNATGRNVNAPVPRELVYDEEGSRDSAQALRSDAMPDRFHVRDNPLAVSGEAHPVQGE